MARDHAKHSPVSLMNTFLVTAASLLIIQGVGSQRVRVDEEVEAYPTESVDLRCRFIDGGGGKTKLTQVSWIWEPVEGKRDNIAVFHPIYGESFPDSPFKGRTVFIQGTLENPSIRISQLTMGDAGRYTCEYATYPSGNEQSTTNLVMLAKPRNSASALTVQAGAAPVVVAECEAADGKPEATIQWQAASLTGNHTTTTRAGAGGTVTVRSEYRLAPSAQDNGKEVTCIVSQRTQDQPQSFHLTLSVEHPPTLTIEGYDNNWYVGRSGATLTCLANSNPPPSSITWTTIPGPLPATVEVEGNKLTVRRVDDAVNTTFVCEVKNRLGVAKQHFTAFVSEKRQTRSSGPPTGAIIGGIIGALVFIGTIGALIFFIRKRSANDGPPKHKPPPPVRTGTSTEMLNKPAEPSLTERDPLRAGIYYETNTEPITDLDDDATPGGALNGGAPPVLEDSALYKTPNDLSDSLPPYTDVDLPLDHHDDDPEVNHELASAAVSRGESFVSAAMYV
ncbi:PVR cell adhesion molecule related 2 like isoform 2-T2 [Aplochiton taeniatus]